MAGPINLRVVDIKNGQLTLNWNGGVDWPWDLATGGPNFGARVVEYWEIERSVDQVNWVPRSGTLIGSSFLDTQLVFSFTAPTVFYYRIRGDWVAHNGDTAPCEAVTRYGSSWSIMRVTVDRIIASDASSADNRLDPRKGPNVLRDYRFGWSIYKGGLFVGFVDDPSKLARSFLKFSVSPPPTDPSDAFWAARLELFYAENHKQSVDYPTDPLNPPPPSVTLQIRRSIQTSWTQQAVKWSNQPALSPDLLDDNLLPAIGGGLWLEPNAAQYRVICPVCHCVQFVDDTILRNGGTVSYQLTAQNETQKSWKYFAKKEHKYTRAPHLLRATGKQLQ